MKNQQNRIEFVTKPVIPTSAMMRSITGKSVGAEMTASIKGSLPRTAKVPYEDTALENVESLRGLPSNEFEPAKLEANLGQDKPQTPVSCDLVTPSEKTTDGNLPVLEKQQTAAQRLHQEKRSKSKDNRVIVSKLAKDQLDDTCKDESGSDMDLERKMMGKAQAVKNESQAVEEQVVVPQDGIGELGDQEAQDEKSAVAKTDVSKTRKASKSHALVGKAPREVQDETKAVERVSEMDDGQMNKAAQKVKVSKKHSVSVTEQEVVPTQEASPSSPKHEPSHNVVAVKEEHFQAHETTKMSKPLLSQFAIANTDASSVVEQTHNLQLDKGHQTSAGVTRVQSAAVEKEEVVPSEVIGESELGGAIAQEICGMQDERKNLKQLGAVKAASRETNELQSQKNKVTTEKISIANAPEEETCDERDMENAKDMTRSTQAVSAAVVTNKPLDGLVLEETVSGDSSTDCQATTHEELPKEADVREVTVLAKNCEIQKNKE